MLGYVYVIYGKNCLHSVIRLIRLINCFINCLMNYNRSIVSTLTSGRLIRDCMHVYSSFNLSFKTPVLRIIALLGLE